MVGTIINLKKISMKLTIKSCFVIAFLVLGFSCKKASDTPGLNDYRPDVPVTVPNAWDYRPQPTIQASKAVGGVIKIILEVPSGRTIKEISKVAATTSYGLLQGASNVGTASSNLYVAGPLPGTNTNQITFTSSITEYMAKTGLTATPGSNAELTRPFYFILTLDNGQVVIPEPVRVFVID
jgi:hypothetical protein